MSEPATYPTMHLKRYGHKIEIDFGNQGPPKDEVDVAAMGLRFAVDLGE